MLLSCFLIYRFLSFPDVCVLFSSVMYLTSANYVQDARMIIFIIVSFFPCSG
jgi:hypothetical protein